MLATQDVGLSALCAEGSLAHWTSNLKGLCVDIAVHPTFAYNCTASSTKSYTQLLNSMNDGVSGQQGRRSKPLGCAAILHLVVVQPGSPLLSPTHTNPQHSLPLPQIPLRAICSQQQRPVRERHGRHKCHNPLAGCTKSLLFARQRTQIGFLCCSWRI